MKLLLILTLVYFSQLYPFVHFHHSHDDDLLPFEISIHPIDIDFHHLPDHSEDNDHHHTYDERVDWHFVRNHSQNIISSVKLIYLPHLNIDEENDKCVARLIETDIPIDREIIFSDPPESRAPPVLA